MPAIEACTDALLRRPPRRWRAIASGSFVAAGAQAAFPSRRDLPQARIGSEGARREEVGARRQKAWEGMAAVAGTTAAERRGISHAPKVSLLRCRLVKTYA